MIKRLQGAGVGIQYNTEVKELRGDERVETVLLINNKTGEEKETAVDWVVICVGTEPDTGLAQAAGLEMDGKFVRVDQHMMTNKPGVFACGEITGGERHLITAASEGSLAGMAASEYLALEKPILSLSKQGGAIHRLLEDSGVPFLLADLEDEEEIRRVLERAARGDFDGGEGWSGVGAFAFDRMALRLATLRTDAADGRRVRGRDFKESEVRYPMRRSHGGPGEQL